MKSKKSKIIKIILVVVISIVVLATLIGTMGLRLVIRNYAKQVTAELGPAAEFFTEFDITMPNSVAVQDITHYGMTITLPGYFKEKEVSLQETRMYAVMDEEGNATESVIFVAPGDVSEINLFSEEKIEKMTDGPLEKYAVKQLMKGFEDLGNGIPDNFYNMTKAYYLLTEKDYSFWNWKQGFAYVVNGIIKNSIAVGCDYTYIYETEDICGFIHVTDRTEQAQSDSSRPDYYVVADMFSTDDFSKSHDLIINCASLETAYAIINSIEIE